MLQFTNEGKSTYLNFDHLENYVIHGILNLLTFSKKKMYSIEICSILVLLNTLLYFIKYIKEGTFSFSTKIYNAELSRWQYYNYISVSRNVRTFHKKPKMSKILITRSSHSAYQLIYIFTYKRSSITLVLLRYFSYIQ